MLALMIYSRGLRPRNLFRKALYPEFIKQDLPSKWSFTISKLTFFK